MHALVESGGINKTTVTTPAQRLSGLLGQSSSEDSSIYKHNNPSVKMTLAM